MIVAAPTRVAVVPVVASTAVRTLLEGAARAGVLLGAGERGAWARVGSEVLIIAPPGGVRMPNGVELPDASFPAGAAGDPCQVGGGGVTLGGWGLRAVRWWDPRPALPHVEPAALRARVAWARGRFAPAHDQDLGRAFLASDPSAVLAAARRLIGNGPGLTPLGDDVLAGALAATLLLGEAVRNRRLCRRAAEVAAAICSLAAERTTALAATLLRHACRGEVDDASAALLQALCGRGDPMTALDRLLALGHSSGTGLATGILAGAAAAGGAP